MPNPIPATCSIAAPAPCGRLRTPARVRAPARLAPWRGTLLLVAALGTAGAAAQEELGSPLPTLAPLIEAVSPAVVNISVVPKPPEQLERDVLRRLFGQEPDFENRRSAGSGVIVNAVQGYIVTNHHVIEDAARIIVTLYDNRGYEAEVVGSDAASDIALLKVEPGELQQIALGDSDALRVGDYVVAIGNPFNFSNTVTAGIVSGLGRSGLDPRRDVYESFIQTDASINPGNSGGALVNLRGELVGINSAIISRSGGNVGIGFAIPVNMMRDVVDQLVTSGAVSRGFLGIEMRPLSLERSRELGLHDMAGAEVSRVFADSGAERAGVRPADVIVAVNGRRITDPGSLRASVGLLRPGEEVELTVIRAREERSLRAVLGEPPPRPEAGEPQEGGDLDERLEGTLIADSIAPDPSDESAGIVVLALDRSSRAADSGLRPGDIITHIDGTRVTDIASATEPLEASGRELTLDVLRDGETLTLTLR